MTSSERQLEEELIEKIKGLKYKHRADIRDRTTLEANFREKFQALNSVKLTDGEFQRLLALLVLLLSDVFHPAADVQHKRGQLWGQLPKIN
jgi:type I restriction enzyme, R subunit